MGLTVGQMYLNILLPILLVNVMYWGAGDTTGLPELIIEELNGRTASEWMANWFPETVPVPECTQLSIQQIVDYACLNDYYYDAESGGSGRKRRQSSLFLTHREASNFLLHRSKRFRSRSRRTTTLSAECCGSSTCIWEEVGEYCYHPREYHLP